MALRSIFLLQSLDSSRLVELGFIVQDRVRLGWSGRSCAGLGLRRDRHLDHADRSAAPLCGRAGVLERSSGPGPGRSAEVWSPGTHDSFRRRTDESSRPVLTSPSGPCDRGPGESLRRWLPRARSRSARRSALPGDPSAVAEAAGGGPSRARFAADENNPYPATMDRGRCRGCGRDRERPIPGHHGSRPLPRPWPRSLLMSLASSSPGSGEVRWLGLRSTRRATNSLRGRRRDDRERGQEQGAPLGRCGSPRPPRAAGRGLFRHGDARRRNPVG